MGKIKYNSAGHSERRQRISSARHFTNLYIILMDCHSVFKIAR